MTQAARPRAASSFVPQNLDATRWEAIEPLLTILKNRPVASAVELEAWLVDRSELEAACSESRANLYITMTCRTDDQAAQSAYTAYIETIAPKLSPALFELDKRQAELSEKFPLDESRYAVLVRTTKADVEIFRQENVPLETKQSLLSQKYDQIIGAMSVEFDGREQTIPQMARYQEVTDRGVREAAWRLVADRRLKDADAIHQIYDDMIAIRHQIARNAGFTNYVGYAFKSKHRFDYGPEDCFAFHEGVERHIVPLMRDLEKRREKTLGVDSLRPWDLGVDVKGRAPLRPFERGHELVSKSVATFKALDPRLAAMLSTMGDGSNTNGPSGGASLDLDSRKGKAPGGYQYMRDRSRRAFIFMNAAGLVRDVVTMVHEAGHAFHSMLCVDEPLLAYRHSPIEFAEVASMSMELLTLPHMDAPGAFYASKEDHARHRRMQVEKSILLLPWIATIDAFQHWVYTNPTHTRAQREQHWLSLDDRFGNAVSWEGLDAHRRLVWQRQLHLFGVPFYYIEYGIAQLGALQLWIHSLEKGEKSAIDAYMRALSLGGSKPLPDLFAAAGLEFDFGSDTIARICDRVRTELDKLPE
ncbi:MAG: M3 family oligoendopeptidase [Phycisphaerales bacterium]|nr:MAG: M3 family oligoendopeptidase [Phycisphaerales bacterium]